MQWESFLTENSIEFVTSGPNTKRGEVSVQCPFCGDDDPSQHMGINLSKEAWGCHRNAEHRGKSPLRLIQALLGCTAAQARLTLAQYNVTDPDSLEGALAMLNAANEPVVENGTEEVFWPAEFRRPAKWPPRFIAYLANRGYPDPIRTAEQFNLKCAVSGKFKDRIMFPLYLNELIGWTGRAITDPVSAPRYLTSTKNAKKTCYGYPEAKGGGSILYLVEGPFDALRINSLDYEGARAMALLGTSISVSQLCIAHSLRPLYKKVYIFLDGDAWSQTMQLSNTIGDWVYMVQAAKHEDPASMSDENLKWLIGQCLTS